MTTPPRPQPSPAQSGHAQPGHAPFVGQTATAGRLVCVLGLASAAALGTGCHVFKSQPDQQAPVTPWQTTANTTNLPVLPTDPGLAPKQLPTNGDATTAPSDVVASEPIDALITHVAGKPLFASAILSQEEGVLRAMAQQTDARTFRDQAADIIQGRLTDRLFNMLTIAEAESGLTEKESQYLKAYLDYQKQEMIRQYGQGSLTLAEANIRKQHGTSLTTFLRVQFREPRLINMYLDKALNPWINVTRRDIERYYNEHPDLFNPEPKFVLRRIRVQDEAMAQTIAERLEKGDAFEEVAHSPDNQINPDNGGLWSNGDPVAADAFVFEGLNQAYANLDKGQWAGPIIEQRPGQTDRHWFVAVDAKIGGKVQSLEDAQRDINRILTEQQKRLYQTRINARLFERAGINNADMLQFSGQILDVALARYAPNTPATGG